jgi:hypothetical protein
MLNEVSHAALDGATPLQLAQQFRTGLRDAIGQLEGPAKHIADWQAPLDNLKKAVGIIEGANTVFGKANEGDGDIWTAIILQSVLVNTEPLASVVAKRDRCTNDDGLLLSINEALSILQPSA